jgi:hypothetical protein
MILETCDPVVSIEQKNSGLDNLFDYSLNDVENESKVGVIGKRNLEKVFQRYKELLIFNPEIYSPKQLDINSILTPIEINAFLQITTKFENCPEYSSLTGFFVSKLISDSFYEGNNGFNLDFRNLSRINNLARGLIGEKEKAIEIGILGNLGRNFCSCSYNLTIAMDGIVTIKNNELFNDFSIWSQNLTAYFGEYMEETDHEFYKKRRFNSKIIYGKKAKSHPEYQRIMKHFSGVIE